jgi:hypothetical protein
MGFNSRLKGLNTFQKVSIFLISTVFVPRLLESLSQDENVQGVQLIEKCTGCSAYRGMYRMFSL